MTGLVTEYGRQLLIYGGKEGKVLLPWKYVRTS